MPLRADFKKFAEKIKKWLTTQGVLSIISLVSRRATPLTEQNDGDLHSGSAVDSDSTCGSSILSSPTRKPQSQLAAVFSGHSAVGSAPRSGRGGRGFKSRCSDQKRPDRLLSVRSFCSSQRDLQRRRPRPAAETGRSCWGRVLIFQSPVKGLRKNQQTQPVGRRWSAAKAGPIH